MQQAVASKKMQHQQEKSKKHPTKLPLLHF